MTTTTLFGYFIIASGTAIVFTLLGIAYEMQKSKVYWMRTIPQPPEHLKPCDHSFEISEVMDITLNPKCTKCGEKLSEVNKINN